MRFSFIRTGVVATAAAVALAACGGRGIVPSQGVNPGGPPIGNAIPAASTCPTATVQPAWIFKGSCDVTTLPPAGTKVTLAAYKGFTESVTLPKNTGKGGAFVVVDAVGGADIEKYKGVAMPKLPTTIGKSALYVQAVNATAGLKFTAGALAFATKGTFPGKNCALSLLEKKGAKYSWLKTPVTAPVKAGTVTYSIPFSSLGVFFPNGLPAGPLYFNISCV